MKKIAIVLVVLVIVFVGAMQYKEKRLRDDLRKQVLSVLKDPSSVQWRDEFLSSDRSTLCGEVNAKNSLGGYVGFKRYVANSHGHLIEGGKFNTWSMEHNKTPVPDYMETGAQLSDEAQHPMATKDIFDFFWNSNCTE